MKKEQIELLSKPLPKEAVKQHPTKKFLSVIEPMAVIERLNEVFGVGGWVFKTEVVRHSGDAAFAVVKGIFIVERENIYLEQYGGNDNKDVGDAYKGSATDALTKIASYLGIGAEIYKGNGNVPPKVEVKPLDGAIGAIEKCDSQDQIDKVRGQIENSTKLTDKEKVQLGELLEERTAIIFNKL